MNHQRNLEIDRLRAFAVIMTVYIHYSRVFFPWSISPQYQHGTTVWNLLNNSWTGVDLFLVISGYVISKTITTTLDALKGNGSLLTTYIKSFYVRRFYRIYPAAWVTFILVLLLSIFYNQGGYFVNPENTIEAGIAILTNTFNYYFAYGLYHGFTLSPYWSLSLEEQYYLIFPIFLLLTHNTRQRVVMLLLLLFTVTFFVRPFTQGDQMIFYTQTRCDGLIYGCLIYYLTQQPWFSTLKINVNSKNRLFWSGVVILLLMALATITAIGFSNNIVIPLACLLAFLLVLLAACESNVISFPQPLQTVLNYIGARSYSLYIIHFPMFSLTQEMMYRYCNAQDIKMDASFAVYYTVIAFVLTIVTTEILYQLVEIPLMKKGKQVSQAMNRSLQPSTVPDRVVLDSVAEGI